VAHKIIEPHPADRLMLLLATEDGWTEKQIGEFFGGISPSRVSSRIHNVRGHLLLHRSRLLWPEPRKVIEICDNSPSLNHAAEKLNVGRQLLASMLHIFGFLSTYKKRWERAAVARAAEIAEVAEKQGGLTPQLQAIHRKRLCRIMQFVAKHVGHTPTMPEMRKLSKHTGGRIPTPHSWIMAFGSFRNGQIAAGLPPNTRGGNRYEHHAKAS
jgi:hypothetical protein